MRNLLINMSRIGKNPIVLPAGVTASLAGLELKIKGPKGEVVVLLHPAVQVDLASQEILLSVSEPTEKNSRSLWGLFGSLINNAVKGVTDGFVNELLIEGVGFKAQVQGKQLNMLLGFTHPVIFDIPEGLTVEAPKPTHLLVKGIDKGKVGHFAAKIHKAFEAEPYKGKGIRYAGEVIRRKAGKTVTK